MPIKKTPLPRLSPPVKRLIRSVGQFIDYWGFMRLQGEMWALVFISRQPLTASDVAKLLGVSKASVSLAMKELVEYEVIYQPGDSKRRNLPLIANEDLTQVIIGVLRLREKQLIQQTIASFDSISSKKNVGLDLDETRLTKMRELMSQADGLLNTLISMGDAARSI